MTTGESNPRNLEQISKQDLESVTEQLKSWIPTLPEQEQLVLGWILTRAAAAEPTDVQGYGAFGTLPFSTLLSQAAGLRYNQDDATTIGPVPIWTYSFRVANPGDQIQTQE